MLMKPAGMLKSFEVLFTDYKTGVAQLPGRVVCILTMKYSFFSRESLPIRTSSNNTIRSWVEKGRFLINVCCSLVRHERVMTQIPKVHYFPNKYFGGIF